MNVKRGVRGPTRQEGRVLCKIALSVRLFVHHLYFHSKIYRFLFLQRKLDRVSYPVIREKAHEFWIQAGAFLASFNRSDWKKKKKKKKNTNRCNIYFPLLQTARFSHLGEASHPPPPPPPNREKTHCIPVIEANAVIYVGTVMVKMLHASVTYPTMLCAQGSHQSTRVTEIFQRVLSSLHLPLFKERNLGTKITLVNTRNGTQNKLVLAVRLNTKNLNKQHIKAITPLQKKGNAILWAFVYSPTQLVFLPLYQGSLLKIPRMK